MKKPFPFIVALIALLFVAEAQAGGRRRVQQFNVNTVARPGLTVLRNLAPTGFTSGRGPVVGPNGFVRPLATIFRNSLPAAFTNPRPVVSQIVTPVNRFSQQRVFVPQQVVVRRQYVPQVQQVFVEASPEKRVKLNYSLHDVARDF